MHVSQLTSDVPIKPGIYRLCMEYNRLVGCLEEEPWQSDACESLGTSRSRQRVQSRTSPETSLTWNHLQNETDESLACDKRLTLTPLFLLYSLHYCLSTGIASWLKSAMWILDIFPPPCVRVRTQTSRSQNVPAVIASGGRKYNKSVK